MDIDRRIAELETELEELKKEREKWEALRTTLAATGLGPEAIQAALETHFQAEAIKIDKKAAAREIVLNHLFEEGESMSLSALVQATGLDKADVRKAIDQLLKEGKILQEGKKKGTTYCVEI